MPFFVGKRATMGVFAFVLGLFAGALLNRIANGLESGRFYGEIRCPYCDTGYDRLLALEGLLLQKLRCKACGAPYLVRHILVEGATAFLFVLIWQRYGIEIYAAFAILYACAFVLMAVTDLEKRIIPNRIVYPAMALALVGELIPSVRNWKVHFLAGMVAFGFFLTLYWFGELFIRLVRKSSEQVIPFGAGDVKLAAFIGLVLGFPEGFKALAAGILLNGLIALMLMLRDLARHRYNPMAAFPYGPGLIISALVFWLL